MRESSRVEWFLASCINIESRPMCAASHQSCPRNAAAPRSFPLKLAMMTFYLIILTEKTRFHDSRTEPARINLLKEA